MAEIQVEAAERRQARQIGTVLARAFYDDPVSLWMLPDDSTRLKGLTRVFTGLARHHFLPRGGSEVGKRDGDVSAATLWDPPGRRKGSRIEELRMMPAMMLALRSRIPAMAKLQEVMDENHPEEPHWYLMLFGSDPSVRGTGFGQALMRSRLDRCDAERVPAYLENSNPKNEAYYLRFGFEVIGEIQVPDGGPKMWPMWRNPS